MIITENHYARGGFGVQMKANQRWCPKRFLEELSLIECLGVGQMKKTDVFVTTNRKSMRRMLQTGGPDTV